MYVLNIKQGMQTKSNATSEFVSNKSLTLKSSNASAMNMVKEREENIKLFNRTNM